MSAHAAHRMDDNSLAAYRAEEPKLSARAAAILEYITKRGPGTDRDIAYGMGFGENLNAVRPRITEMLEVPFAKLMKVCDVRCPVTGKTVRKVDLRKAREQGALFS